MNASFGIDHPLLATHDIEALRQRLVSIGFNMTPVGRHPWGTSTSLAMFEGCLVEIMGVYDASLIDQIPAGEFRFGRHVYEHLLLREGVALTALHSTNSVIDAEYAAQVGYRVAGHLEFGRDVTLPNGTQGRTKTTLALLPDDRFARLSFFLCQQHRPDLIYVPEWLEHPNTACGICGVNIVAHVADHPDLKQKFGGLYQGVRALDTGFEFDTANGVLRVMTAQGFERDVGLLSPEMQEENTPFIAGMDITVENLGTLSEFLKAAKLPFQPIAKGLVLTCPALFANTTLRFFSKLDPECS